MTEVTDRQLLRIVIAASHFRLRLDELNSQCRFVRYTLAYSRYAKRLMHRLALAKSRQT